MCVCVCVYVCVHVHVPYGGKYLRDSISWIGDFYTFQEFNICGYV